MKYAAFLSLIFCATPILAGSAHPFVLEIEAKTVKGWENVQTLEAIAVEGSNTFDLQENLICQNSLDCKKEAFKNLVLNVSDKVFLSIRYEDIEVLDTPIEDKKRFEMIKNNYKVSLKMY